MKSFKQFSISEAILNPKTISSENAWKKVMDELIKLGKKSGFKMSIPPGSSDISRKPSLEKAPFHSPAYAAVMQIIYYTLDGWEDGEEYDLPKKMTKIKPNKHGSYDVPDAGDDAGADLMAYIYIALKDMKKAGGDINVEKEYKRLIGR